MTLEELRKNYRDDILALAKKYHCSNVRVFGSVVKNAAGKESDVDFLVRAEKGMSLFDLSAFGNRLEDLLHKQVDVVTDRSEIFFPSILEEAVPL